MRKVYLPRNKEYKIRVKNGMAEIGFYHWHYVFAKKIRFSAEKEIV